MLSPLLDPTTMAGAASGRVWMMVLLVVVLVVVHVGFGGGRGAFKQTPAEEKRGLIER